MEPNPKFWTRVVLRLERYRIDVCHLTSSFALFVVSVVFAGIAQADTADFFDDWLTRAIQAPAESSIALEGDEEAQSRSHIELRQDVMTAFPKQPADEPLALTTREISKISRLLALLNPTNDINPYVFLDELAAHYTWEEATREQLLFLKLMYQPPDGVSESTRQHLLLQELMYQPPADVSESTRHHVLLKELIDQSPADVSETVLENVEVWNSSRSPESYLRLIREKALAQRWKESEKLCSKLITEYPELPQTQQREVYSFWLLSLVSQAPLKDARADQIMDRLADEDAFQDHALWNLGLRLLFRNVVNLKRPEDRSEAWQVGLNQLSPYAKWHSMGESALADLDEFLAFLSAETGGLEEPSGLKTPSLEPVSVLTAFTAMGLDLATLRKLHQRLIDLPGRTGSREDVLDGSWRQLVLNTSPDGDPVDAFEHYLELARSLGLPSEDEVLTKSYEPDDLHWGESPELQSIGSSAGQMSAGLLGQRIIGGVVHGHPLEGLLPAQFALALSSTIDAWREFDAMGLVCVGATRDLRLASEPLRWHLQRVMQQPISDKSLEENQLSRHLRLTWDAATASVKKSHGSAFFRQSDYVQRLVLQEQLIRRAEAYSRWAIEAERQGRPKLSALYWGQALTDGVLADKSLGAEDRHVRRVEKALQTSLRGQADRSEAIKMVGRIDHELDESLARESLLFLGATLLYENGQMSDCLLVLDRVEALNPQWGDSKQLAAGLIRSLALIKLNRLEESDSVLSRLEPYRGEDEVMAQIVFLRGWIQLNNNQVELALVFFRNLVDVYPSTSYALKTRELIHRIEPTRDVNSQP